MEGLLDSALERWGESATNRFRTQAQELGWDERAAASVTARVDSVTGNLSPTWSEEDNDRVLDYEGGSTIRSPLPAIHKFFESPEGFDGLQDDLYQHLDEMADDLKKRLFS